MFLDPEECYHQRPVPVISVVGRFYEGYGFRAHSFYLEASNWRKSTIRSHAAGEVWVPGITELDDHQKLF